jgi:hypothetical protein
LTKPQVFRLEARNARVFRLQLQETEHLQYTQDHVGLLVQRETGAH